MIVRDVLHTKGTDVVTVAPTATITELVSLLAEHRIGAVIVSAEGGTVDGIISERDITRALDSHGATILSMRVSELMTAKVRTCSPSETIRDVAVVMTEGRFRHLPVIDDGALIGIVSIGDIVKKRIDELETETGQLMDYLASS